ncbi:hypothetical protein HYPSUDRAFT_1079181 [Hypholoma sublateritium FD-334 SS-4]|uniref:Uncharacterized protein n=1 Tax=Hypholoma sublateritium (strain FD-334 SS-4) TaxID=945553 RepID=A0A0D2L9J3_HYPSF|nr:hypothetical protein HYPSUDRAFT_1079181 [Hypholoma sublateritium FD-334 SS-4]
MSSRLRKTLSKASLRGLYAIAMVLCENNPDRKTQPLKVLVSGGASIILSKRQPHLESTKCIEITAKDPEVEELFAAKQDAWKKLPHVYQNWLVADHLSDELKERQMIYNNSINNEFGPCWYAEGLAVYTTDWKFQLGAQIRRSILFGADQTALEKVFAIIRILVDDQYKHPLLVSHVYAWYSNRALLAPDDLRYIVAAYQARFPNELTPITL